MTKLILIFAVLCILQALQGTLGCSDKYTNCELYKNKGYCKTTTWTKKYCQKTCNFCRCKDTRSLRDCSWWKKKDYCRTNSYVKRTCKATCNLCGTLSTTVTPTPGTTKVYPSQTPGSCGVSIVKDTRVIAGQKSKSGQWPWQISMFKNGRFSCGGSLITPQWVVTAAHCVARRTSASSMKIVLGDLHRSRKSGKEQTIGVTRIISHASYGSTKLNYDIALIKLSNPAQLNDHVRTVCLPKQGEHIAVGSKCYISGWGKTRHPGSSVQDLQHASLTIISKSECTKTNSKIAPIKDQMLCAKNGRPARQSGCHGDSGGPFVCQKNDGSWTLHGAVSWGSPRCDIFDASTVFARISALRNWIDDQMKKY